MRKRPPGSGSANTGTTGAPVLQRERGQRGRRRCRPVEEVDVDGVRGLDVLIDQHRDRLVRFERPEHAPDRAAPVDDGVARLPPRRLQQIVEQRIVERSREHRHRAKLERVHERIDLPEAEVAGEEQDALALRVCRDDALFAFERRRAPASGPALIVLNFKRTVSSRPKCENIPRAIARHSAPRRSGNAAWMLRTARRRCGPSTT